MTNYKSYELLAHYNEFGANNSTIVNEILAHGDFNFQIPSSVPYKGTSLKGYTVLHVALKKEDYEIFQMLVNSGADFTIKNAGGSTILHQAIENTRDMKKYRKFIDSVLSAHVNLNVSKNPHDNNGVSHFHVACTMNRVDAVELFLNSGVSVDETVTFGNFAGYTALHFAAEYCCLQTVKILLNRGASVSVKDARGRTPLHLVISRKMRILDWKNMGKRAEWGGFKAELETNEQIIDLFIEKWGVQSDEVLDGSLLSHFHVACTFQDTSRVEKLLEKFVDLEHCIAANSPLWPGYTALHFAAHCNPETAVLLLKNGADFLAKDISGVTPLDLCLQRYEVKHLHRFVSLEPALQNTVFNDGRTRLTDAILAMKNKDTLSDFIRKITDINIALESSVWSGYTLLHLATVLPERSERYSALDEFIHAEPSEQLENLYNCSEESEALYLDRIKMCFDRGANISATDAHNSTALHLAFKLQKESVVKFLLSHLNPPVDFVNNDNLSYLHVACAASNENVVKSLLSKSVDHVNRAVTNKYKYRTAQFEFGISAGATPLHLAVSTGNEKIVELLLKNKADRYARDASGLMPIHYAFVEGLRNEEKGQIFRELARILLLSDDLSECETSFGLTHLHVASYANDKTAIEKLLLNEANLEATISSEHFLDEELKCLKPVDGFTPLHLAFKYESKEAIITLVQSGADFLAAPPKIGFELHEKHSDFLAATLISDLVSQEAIKRKFGLTELHAACATLDVDRTTELLKRGENPDAQVHRNSPLWAGNAAFHFALMKREDYLWENITSIVWLLWDYRADVSLINSNNETAFLNAFWRSRESDGAFYFSNLLLENHHDFKINPVDKQGWSHFHAACMCDSKYYVKKFLECGVNVNQPIDYMSAYYTGRTPIHIAAHHKYNEMTDLLLKYGADIGIRDLLGWTPLHAAINFDFYRFFNITPPTNLARTPVMSLLKAGVDQTSLTPKGELAVEIFLKTQRITSDYIGVDLENENLNLFNLVTDEGYLAMGISRERDIDELHENLIYQALIKEPKKHIPDIMGRTPLHNVISIFKSKVPIKIYAKVIEQLIALGFDIDDRDLHGRTALHWATKFYNWKAARALLTLGTDINITDINDETPLTYVWRLYESQNRHFHAVNQRNERLIFQVIVGHVYKLRHLRTFISNANNDIVGLFEKRVPWSSTAKENLENEVKKLKSRNIYPFKMTLWDLLPKISSYPSMRPWKRQAIDNFFQNNKTSLRNEFPQSSGLMLLQYEKALNRATLLIPAKNSFNLLTAYQLPDLCCDIVLTFFNSKNLENLIKSETLDEWNYQETSKSVRIFTEIEQKRLFYYKKLPITDQIYDCILLLKESFARTKERHPILQILFKIELYILLIVVVDYVFRFLYNFLVD